LRLSAKADNNEPRQSVGGANHVAVSFDFAQDRPATAKQLGNGVFNASTTAGFKGAVRED
jgi:hypothetical protein